MPRIAVIPGDGVGVEVAREGVKVLSALSKARNLNLEFEHFDYGADRYLKDGTTLPDSQMESFRNDFDAIYLGAVGDPRVPSNAHAKDILLGMRFKLDLYINYRPCRLLHERFCPLKGKTRKDVDFVVFRENTEGAYAGIGGNFKKGTEDEIATCEELNTYKGVERILRAALDYAKDNGKTKVCLADKANAIPAHDLYRRVFKKLLPEYPGIEGTMMYVDALAMVMVQKPEAFEVIVSNNLFGDILTDLGSALVGGLGLAPSANINPGRIAMFEPVHGSAPDIAGKGLANPTAMVLTGALMLRYLEFEKEAAAIEAAVEEAIADGKVTRDLGGTLSTSEAGDELTRRVLARAAAL